MRMRLQFPAQLFCTLAAILISLAIAYISTHNPLKNWDIVGYTAVILKEQHKQADELHSATWRALENSLGDTQSLRQGNAYVQAVSESPEALLQTLNYYAPRIAYTFSSSQLSKATGIDIPRSTVLTSALSISALFLLTYFTLKKNHPPPTALAITLLLAACLHWLLLSRASTPDAMATLLALSAVLLLREDKFLAYALCCALLILVRHDQIIFVLFLTIFHAASTNRKKAVFTILFLSIFSSIYIYSQWPGWSQLFMHTFSENQVYHTPSYIDPRDVLIQYANQWKTIFHSAAKDTQTLIPAAAFIVFLAIRKNTSPQDRHLLDALALAISAKLIIFPAVSGPWARLYMGEITAIIVMAMTMKAAPLHPYRSAERTAS